ncbi:YbaB/EbfC family DNA-binding protein [Mycobacterium sp. M1]|uniref:YbaB/EbfC family DNA-binding protein n=1 Tax=Mycolicibacter acidiphilus TaxID=2835306 RepID=A0ABS5REV6_9MYCO|nr:YbaB/EbfC family DNA-binding protein [Mycolicibacter acidiphilus]MBS9532803.1 YbaB/EbfC family DNA-binding protein [Mycolicibacter acidiphilus]
MDSYPSDPHGDDDLAALDFSVGDQDEGSGLDAFDAYTAVEEDADDGGWASIDPLAQADEPDEVDIPGFLVTNPPGTVSVTAYMDGRVGSIELSPKVTDMTEAELADEIVVIARLAREKARSAQYVFISEVMQQLGPGTAETQEFLGRTMGLPSPAEAQEEEARVFSTRYASDHE